MDGLETTFFLAERSGRGQTFSPGGTAARVAQDVRQYLIITALTGGPFFVYLLMRKKGTLL